GLIFAAGQTIRATEHAQRNWIVADRSRLFILSNGFGVFPLQLQSKAVTPMCKIEIRVHFDAFTKLRNGFIEAAVLQIGVTGVGVDNERERIELERAFHFREVPRLVAGACEHIRSKPMMRGSIVSIQSNGALVLG